jgi:hypothetical protein
MQSILSSLLSTPKPASPRSWEGSYGAEKETYEASGLVPIPGRSEEDQHSGENFRNGNTATKGHCQ